MAVAKPNIVRVSIPSGHYGVGRKSPISQISEHHIVGDSNAVLAKAKSAVFSCTFTIAMDGTIFQLVDLKDTAYCDNDYNSNSRSISIEHAGGHPNYPYTEAMYRSSIRLHAWLFQQYGNLNCIRHREIPEIKADRSKATACPGSLDVNRIVTQAKQLLSGGDEVFKNINEVKEAFLMLRGKVGSTAEMKLWIGKPKQSFFRTAKKEADRYRQQNVDLKAKVKSLTNSINSLKEKLRIANSQPPEIVIQEVEKIVNDCDVEPVQEPEPKPIITGSWLSKLIAALLRKKK